MGNKKCLFQKGKAQIPGRNKYNVPGSTILHPLKKKNIIIALFVRAHKKYARATSRLVVLLSRTKSAHVKSFSRAPLAIRHLSRTNTVQYSTVFEIEGEGCRGRAATLLTVRNQHLSSTVTKVAPSLPILLLLLSIIMSSADNYSAFRFLLGLRLLATKL